MSQVIMGMDPHKRSATIEVMASDETVVGGGRYATDAAGYRAMLAEAKRWPERTWAIEGCQGIGRHIANRLLADGQDVVDVPPKLSARTRVFATGQGRKTDATDAHSVALAATRMPGLRRVAGDQQLAVLRILANRRRSRGEDHTRMVSQLHQLLLELIPGGAKKDLSAAQAKEPVRRFTPCLVAGIGGLPEPLLPVLAEQAVPAATALRHKAGHSVDQNLISEAVVCGSASWMPSPGGYPDRPMCFSMLGSALRGLRPALSGMTGDFTELLQKTLPEPCPGDRGKAQGLHYVRSAQSFPTAPIVLREQAHESSAAVHSPVDSTGRHAGEAVCSSRIGVCVESVDNRRSGKFGQVSPGIALSAFCAQEKLRLSKTVHIGRKLSTLGISRTTSYAKPRKVAHRRRAMRPSGGQKSARRSGARP